ncbi:MAG: hypothetical protein LH645_06440 [Actinomycetia bacterium]|nr:hypothetical protein [Actinomycetes bacterium]
MSASAFKEWDVEPESDGTEWSGFLGYSGVSPGMAAAMIRRQDRAIIEYDDLFEDNDDER